jgi:hypothetical protein
MSIRAKLDELHVLNQRLAKLLGNVKSLSEDLTENSDKVSEALAEFENLVAYGKQLKEDIQTLMAMNKEEKKEWEEPSIIPIDAPPTDNPEVEVTNEETAEDTTKPAEADEEQSVEVVEEQTVEDQPVEVNEEQVPEVAENSAVKEHVESVAQEEIVEQTEPVSEDVNNEPEVKAETPSEEPVVEVTDEEPVTEAQASNHPAEVKDITTSAYYTDSAEEFVLKGSDVRTLGNNYSFSCARCGNTVNGANGGNFNILANFFKAAPKILPKERCKADLDAHVVLCDKCLKSRGEDGYWTTGPVTFLLESVDGKLQKNALIADGVYDTEAEELLNAINGRVPEDAKREQCHMIFKQRFK